ncbi:MAG: SRPBCC domain-containing protein, partial [Sediminispirochaetaceae bacterium]
SEQGRIWFSGSDSEGIETEPRVLKEGSHIRLRWKLPGWTHFSTLQIRIVSKGTAKTTLTVHQEKLADQATRERMLEYWREKMTYLEKQWREKE